MATIAIRVTLSAPESAVSITTLTRSDTGLPSGGVTLPIALANVSGNVWTGSFTDAAPPPFYNAIAQITFGSGGLGYSPPFQIQGTVGPAGMWGTFAQAVGFYGADNLNLWSTASGTGAPDLSMQQAAFNRADNDIITEITKQYYVVPGPTGALATNLAYIEAELFGAYLYEANGLQDSAKGMDGKMQAHRDNAMSQLQELLFYNRGGFTGATGYSDAPVGVGPTVDALGRNVGAAPPLPRWAWNGSFWNWG